MSQPLLDHLMKLGNVLDDGELPEGRLTTYKTAADRFSIPHDEIGKVVSFLGRHKYPGYLPVHRIVGGRGFLAAAYPEWCIERLVAEGWSIGTTERGAMHVIGFRDYWLGEESVMEKLMRLHWRN